MLVIEHFLLLNDLLAVKMWLISINMWTLKSMQLQIVKNAPQNQSLINNILLWWYSRGHVNSHLPVDRCKNEKLPISLHSCQLYVSYSTLQTDMNECWRNDKMGQNTISKFSFVEIEDGRQKSVKTLQKRSHLYKVFFKQHKIPFLGKNINKHHIWITRI